MNDNDINRLLSKVDITDSCWNWNGATNKDGYGYIKINGNSMRAHRVMYEYSIGIIPEGKVIDHLCRNRRCVNVDHMEVVTRKENVLRGQSASAIAGRRYTCAKGHLYTAENTRMSKGYRECRTCARAYKKKNRDKNREKS